MALPKISISNVRVDPVTYVGLRERAAARMLDVDEEPGPKEIGAVASEILVAAIKEDE